VQTAPLHIKRSPAGIVRGTVQARRRLPHPAGVTARNTARANISFALACSSSLEAAPSHDNANSLAPLQSSSSSYSGTACHLQISLLPRLQFALKIECSVVYSFTRSILFVLYQKWHLYKKDICTCQTARTQVHNGTWENCE
jgi:hypothetical protein